jgi:hypothetical protein
MGYVIEVAGYAAAFSLAALLAALAVPYFVLTERRYLRGRSAGKLS